ncbi:MAG: Hpt domain-containing protein [Acidiferrobacterales bacterium]
MSTTSKVDPSTLGWVKSEIDESLKQAHIALESFAENPSDDTRLRFCITHLHQVVGTLQMVELDGAAMLGREAETLAEAILNEDIAANDDVLELLTRAILLLPDYLGGLQFGQAEAPLRLLPIINELRTAAGHEPVSDEELFVPDLSVRPPPREDDDAQLTEDEYAQLAQRLRPNLQAALLSWLRDSNDAHALASISSAVEELERKAPVGVLEQLFWVAGGLLEALAPGGLELSNDRKKLVARLDQQIKKLIDRADKSVLRNSSEALVKLMLYQLGAARSDRSRVAQLKHAFGLEGMLGVVADESTDTITLPEPETIRSVSTALGEEVKEAQELLSGYFDPDREDVDSIEPLLEMLRKMAGTMDLLGIPSLKELVDQLRVVTTAVVEGKLEPSENASMRMAHALLLVEHCSRDIWAPSWKKQLEDWTQALRGLLSADDEGVPDTSGIEVAEVSEGEFGELVSVVAEEMRATLTNVEEAVEAFAADASNPAHLEDISAHLSQVQGALQILGEEQEQALRLAEVIRERVEQIRTGQVTPSPVVLDALAVCIGTLSAHAEGLQAGRRDIDDLMEAAINDMGLAVSAAELGDVDAIGLIDSAQEQVARWLEGPAEGELAVGVQQNLEQLATIARIQGHERIERISLETGALLAIVAEDPAQLTDEIRETVARSIEALATLVSQHLGGTETVSAAPPPVTPPASEPIVEEPIMVEHGAEPAPEPPPKVEPVTERVAAEPVSAPSTPEPAPQAAAPQPPVADVTPPPTQPVPASAPAAPAEAEAAAPAVETAPAPAPTRPAAALPDDVDPEMLEIFIEEAREVLEAINSEFPKWRDNSDNEKALAEVRRGFHTLKGSGRMVGASTIGELAWAIENMLNKVRDSKIPPSEALFAAVTDVKEVLPDLIAQLEGAPAPGADIEALRERADAIANGEPVSVASSEQPAEEPASSMPPAESRPAEAEEAFPKLEPTLLNIFTGEAQGHLDTIAHEIEGCRQSGGACMVTHALLRATHTLRGSARSVGIHPMSEASAEMEHLLEAMEELNLPLEERHLALLDELMQCCATAVQLLTDDVGSSSEIRSRLAELVTRIQREADQLPKPEVVEQRAAEPAEPEQEATAAEPVSEPSPPPPAVSPPSVTRGARLEEDIDPELVDVFLEEATDLLATIEEALRHWRGDQNDAQALEDLKRGLHTLKGGARMASAMVVGNLAHTTEDLVKRVEDNRLAPSSGLFDLLDEVHDVLVTLIDEIRQARPLSSVDALSAKLARALAGEPLDKAVQAVSQNKISAGAEPTSSTEQAENDAVSKDVEAGDESEPELMADRRSRDEDDADPIRQRRDRRGQVRVRTSVLTDLVNDAGEVSISRARMEQQVYGFRDNLGELNRNVSRFRDQLRELEIQSESAILYRTEQTAEGDSSSGFDPLELDRFSRLQQLSRSLTESLHDLSTIEGSLHAFAGEAETVLQQQARINTSLQEGLMRTRMIAFSTQAARLRHITRQTTRELGKRVDLRITGQDVDVDRNVLERMMGPFEHMIRNALDHGIEGEEERRRLGKPPVGTVTIDTRQEGTEIAISFSDDGAGLDIDAIRRRAIEHELVSEDKDLSDNELIQFILVAGFSTASEVTHLSGRGVGMDVVENEVKQLGGNMAVSTTAGEGTTFTIHLPVTLSVTQALLVNVGDQRFAIPLSAIVNIIEVPTDQLNVSMGKNPLLNFNDQIYSFMDVGARLGIPTAHHNGGKVPVLLAKIGTREVAIQVDGLLTTREIVVKPLGPQLSELKGVAGATVLGDGTVVLILDVGGLWLTDEALHVERVTPAAEQEKAKRRPVVMVVDDSLTVRKVTGRHLQKRGLEVLTAKDGVDALEQLQDHVVDVMLVDIEMPRMDGYELTSRIKGDSRFRHIPIIIITSRAGEKHRKRAFGLGVNSYMSKPYQEDELFDNIQSLLPEQTVH